jgi:hypothetical protein
LQSKRVAFLTRSDILAEAFCHFHGSKLHHTVLQLWRS